MIRKIASILGIMAAGVLFFDVVAYFGFPLAVQKIASEYANGYGPELWRRLRLQRPYQYSPTRGFDIRPGSRSIAAHPPEIPPYEIWGNSVGCFDDEPPAGVAPDIYLAGDSFTWGFSPYETKFGTLIERETGLLVYACGVAHTGQRHQFDKFLEVAESFPGWPRLVIVNVFSNDIANDYAFPHTEVRDGVSYEDRYLHEEPDWSKIARPAPEEILANSSDLKYYLKTYSATANIVYQSVKLIRGDSDLWQDSVLDVYDKGAFPIHSDVAKEHRKIVRKWINHAKKNGYKIVFSLIPYRDSIGNDAYADYMDFIKQHGGKAWNFESYILSIGLDPAKLHWKVDFHLNPRGNAAYANFLLQKLDSAALAGTLPERFARRGRSSAGATALRAGGGIGP